MLCFFPDVLSSRLNRVELHCRLLSRPRLCTRRVSGITKHTHIIFLIDGALHRSITLRLTRLRTTITPTFALADTLKLNVTSRRFQIAQRSHGYHRFRRACLRPAERCRYCLSPSQKHSYQRSRILSGSTDSQIDGSLAHSIHREHSHCVTAVHNRAVVAPGDRFETGVQLSRYQNIINGKPSPVSIVLRIYIIMTTWGQSFEPLSQFESVTALRCTTHTAASCMVKYVQQGNDFQRGQWNLCRTNAECRHYTNNLRRSVSRLRTISIILSSIEVILACHSLVVNIAFGLLQLRALDPRNRDQIDFGKPRTSEPGFARAVSNPQTAKTIAFTPVDNSKDRGHQLGHGLGRLGAPIAAVVVRQPV